MTSQCILEVLPLDIMELVIQESKECNHRKNFHDLRLICKALNDLVEPHAFSTVTIRFEKDTSGKWKSIPEFLLSLASGTSPYVRWAKRLRVEALVTEENCENDNKSLARYDSWHGSSHLERQMMLACQKEWLDPAIASLARVERVVFMCWICSSDSYHEALRSLTKLPQLRSLSILLFGPIVVDLSLPTFSNLRSLQIQGLTVTPHVLEGLKHILTRSPSITDLWLSGSTERNEIEVDRIELCSLFEGIMPLPVRASRGGNKPSTLPSTLKTLAISARRFELSPSCTPFLRALTRLLIWDSSTHIQPLFWKSLLDSGVQLQELTVGPLLQPIIDYLRSYSGLQQFELAGIDKDRDQDKNAANQFFYSILPMHRSTMQNLSFRNFKPGSWFITQSYLEEGICLCKNLEAVELHYYFSQQENPLLTVPLTNLLSRISDSLPRLRNLWLSIHRTRQDSVGIGPTSLGPRHPFTSYITGSKPQFAAKHRPQFLVQAEGSEFIPTLTGLDLGISAQYCLEPVSREL